MTGTIEPTHLLLILLMVAAVVLWVLALIGIVRSPGLSTAERVIWVLVVLVLPFLGSIGWFLFGRPRHRSDP